MRRVRALFYAINGTGSGHISRQLNIARATRELLHAMGMGADFHLLTSSEAPEQGWDFPTYKLPSKTVINEADTPNREFRANTQYFITNLVGTIRPHLLVLDTMPQGSYGEFTGLLPFARQTVFVGRHTNKETARSSVYRSHIGLYDLVLVPDPDCERSRYEFPPEVEDRTVFTECIHGYHPEDAWTREQVGAYYGALPSQTIIYVSAGGGGDKYAQTDLQRLVTTIGADPNNFVLVGYGPLYRGSKIYRPNVIPLTEPDIRHLFGGIDLALSAAGYNTCEELLAAQVPTAFFAQVKGMDCQDERIARGVREGWNLALEDLSPETLQQVVMDLKQATTQRRLRNNLSARGVPMGALNAAVELLRLRSYVAKDEIDLPTLFAVATMRRVWPQVNDREGVTFVEAAKSALILAATCWNQSSRQRHFVDCMMHWGGSLIHPVFQRLIQDGVTVHRLRAQNDPTVDLVDVLLQNDRFVQTLGSYHPDALQSASSEQTRAA